MVVVVGGLELHVHEIHGADGRDDEEDLHHRVVHRYEVGKQVQVTREENQCEEDL